MPAQRQGDEEERWPGRAQTHKVVVRPDIPARTWFWACLTCGTEAHSDHVYANVAAARAAAEGHSRLVDVLR